MQFHIENMTCGGCANSVTKAIQSVDGQAKVDADPVRRTVTVESSQPRDALIAVLEEAGYPASK
ncbi:copper chaperone [Georhizobium profundi]|jgi:copper chaperone|uniref:Copper chaperone n=1 Tax=Georhizobium profundi TaxID=2341112 RepID=A0A3S9B3N6_9HYPH|nr:heavy-metal-associated domain-containing protein [Georhizobium profundi]AZN71481.1 copper chaperone [Georhizobium profundi]